MNAERIQIAVLNSALIPMDLTHAIVILAIELPLMDVLAMVFN